MPRRGQSSRQQVYWWTEEIAALRQSVLRARRTYIRRRRGNAEDTEEARDDMREARRLLKNAINASQREYWKRLCQEVDEDVWGKGFKIATKVIKGHNQPMTKTAAETK